MSDPYNLWRPDQEKIATEPRPGRAERVGALLHFVFGGLDDRHRVPQLALRVLGRWPGIPHGLHDYDPDRHQLRFCEPSYACMDPGAADLCVQLALRHPMPHGDALLDVMVRRLVLTASELDLECRPAECDDGLAVRVLDPGDDAADPAPGEEPSRLEALLSVVPASRRRALIEPSAFDRLVAMARTCRLPSRDVGLECRLAADDERVDLAAALETRLWGVPPSRDLLPPGADTSGWQALDHLRRAAAACDALRRNLRHVGVELDIEGDGTGDEAPPPGLFVGLSDGTWCADVGRAVDATLDALMGAEGHAAARDDVEMCLDSLPPGSVIHYAGAFAGRAPGVARLNVEVPDRDEALRLLRRRGFSAAALDLYREVQGWGARVVLALDLGTVPFRRCGFELLFDGMVGVAPVLDHLVARGWCAPEKRDALLSWPAALQEPAFPGSWPAPLAATHRRAPSLSVVFTKLSHLKLVAVEHGASDGSDPPPTAKAYLQLQHAWVPAVGISPFLAPHGSDPARTRASRHSPVVRAEEPK